MATKPAAPSKAATAKTTAKGPFIERYIDAAGAHRWRLKGRNGEILATGEGYPSAAHCRRAVARVTAAFVALAPAVIVEGVEKMAVEAREKVSTAPKRGRPKGSD